MNATVSALSFTSGDQTFRTDRFSYLLCGTAADAPFRCEGSRWELSEDRAAVELPELSLRVTRTMRACDGGAEESIEFYNYGEKKLRFSTIKLGWLLPLQELTLHAIPFTVQQDGWRHVYSAETLRCGEHFQIVNNRAARTAGPVFRQQRVLGSLPAGAASVRGRAAAFGGVVLGDGAGRSARGQVQ